MGMHTIFAHEITDKANLSKLLKYLSVGYALNYQVTTRQDMILFNELLYNC